MNEGSALVTFEFEFRKSASIDGARDTDTLVDLLGLCWACEIEMRSTLPSARLAKGGTHFSTICRMRLFDTTKGDSRVGLSRSSYLWKVLN